MNMRLLLAAALMSSLPAAAQELSRPLESSPDVRLTDSCNTIPDAPSQVILDAAPATREEIVSKVANPSADPGLLHALWMPRQARQTNFLSFENEVIADYVDRFQDTAQIVSSINTDAGLAARGVQHAYPNTYACFAALPPASYVTATEFYQPLLNHYQLALSAAEREALRADGWIATGDSFRALDSGTCYGGVNVFRFARGLGQRRGSRFLTIDAQECGSVRKSNPAWRPQDVPFFARPATGGQCQSSVGEVAVYRAYNGREAFNDMNHRYTTSFATYNGMIAQGWKGEGIAFCVAGQ